MAAAARAFRGWGIAPSIGMESSLSGEGWGNGKAKEGLSASPKRRSQGKETGICRRIVLRQQVSRMERGSHGGLRSQGYK